MRQMTGGSTNYGQYIGILMVDTAFPRFPGDIGNATTYPFPVRYQIVENACLGDLLAKNHKACLADSFVEAAKELEAQGVKAITTSCGYLAPYQQVMADAVKIPVITSSLMMVPFLRQMLNKERSIAIFTGSSEKLNEAFFSQLGWQPKDLNAIVRGMPEEAEFRSVYSRNKTIADLDILNDEIVAMAKAHVAEHPDTGVILFECTNIGPFAKSVQQAVGLPVFSINNLIEFVALGIHARDYIAQF